jgi:hypothetical protein
MCVACVWPRLHCVVVCAKGRQDEVMGPGAEFHLSSVCQELPVALSAV